MGDQGRRRTRVNDSDGDLLRRAGRGDVSAYHELIDRYAPRLYRVAAAMVGPTDADDVLQETFAGAFRSLHRFDGRSSLRTWLTAILLRQAARWRRGRARHRARPLEWGEEAASADSGMARHDLRMDLLAALDELPAEQREAFVLRQFDGLSYREMARILKVPPGTVESRLFRARQALKTLLEDYLADTDTRNRRL